MILERVTAIGGRPSAGSAINSVGAGSDTTGAIGSGWITVGGPGGSDGGSVGGTDTATDAGVSDGLGLALGLTVGLAVALAVGLADGLLDGVGVGVGVGVLVVCAITIGTAGEVTATTGPRFP